jgi:hypothetical protein
VWGWARSSRHLGGLNGIIKGEILRSRYVILGEGLDIHILHGLCLQNDNILETKLEDFIDVF